MAGLLRHGSLATVLLLFFAFTFPGSAQTINGALTYAGAPMTPTASPEFHLVNESTAEAVDAMISYASGTFDIRGLPPGSYSLQVWADENTANPMLYPGDFESYISFDATTAAASGLAVSLRRTMHLTGPHDNASVIYTSDEDCVAPVLPTEPVQFTWDAIEGAATYGYSIARYSCSPFQLIEFIRNGSTTSTSLTEALPANGPNEVYRLHMSAFTAETDAGAIGIGAIVTHGPSGHSLGYRFRVEEDTADLVVTKKVTWRWWAPFSRTCTITVKNLGPSEATRVTVRDVLPSDWLAAARLDRINASSGWTCTRDDGTITCRRPTLAAGASATVSFRLRRTAAGRNRVTVSASTADPVQRNNSSSVLIP